MHLAIHDASHCASCDEYKYNTTEYHKEYKRGQRYNKTIQYRELWPPQHLMCTSSVSCIIYSVMRIPIPANNKPTVAAT
jgi:hypothetical protein